MAVVKYGSSWGLGEWRGAYGKARNVPLAEHIHGPTYDAGYEHGRANSRDIKARARVAAKPRAGGAR